MISSYRRFLTVPRMRSLCEQLWRKNYSKLSFELNTFDDTNAIETKKLDDLAWNNEEWRFGLTKFCLFEAAVEHVVFELDDHLLAVCEKISV